MSAISGKNGDVVKDGVSICETTKWDFTAKANNGSGYASNCSNGAKRRKGGTTDASASLEGKWDPGSPVYGTGAGQLKEGTEVVLYLYLDDYQYIEFPAVVDDFKWTVDMDSGDIIGWTCALSEMDAWTSHLAEESSNSSSSSSSSS